MDHHVPPHEPQGQRDEPERNERGAEILDERPVGDPSLGQRLDRHRLGGREKRRRQSCQHVARIERLELAHPLGHRNAGLLFRQGRRDLRIEHRPADDVDEVEEGEEEAREHRRGVELHDRLSGDRRVDDDHHRRRDQDAERAAGGDDAGGELHVVAGAQHRVEGDHAHQHHHGADEAARDAPERAHDQRRDRERRRHAPERRAGCCRTSCRRARRAPSRIPSARRAGSR